MTIKSEEYKEWFKLAVNADVGVGNFLEYIIQIIYSSIVSPGDSVVDGGANRGMHTLPLARAVGSKGMVIGFEAIPQLADDLSRKIQGLKCKNISIKAMALGDKEGVVDFHYVPDCDYRSGLKEMVGIPEAAKLTTVKISVPVVTLDKFIDPALKLRFIKLDLEGGEYHALRGSSRIMSNDEPLIVFENGRQSSASVYGYSRTEWFSLFSDLNYKLFDVFGREFKLEDWDKTDWDQSCIPWYFIALRRQSDELFVKNVLPNVIGTLYRALSRHCIRT